MIWWLIGPLFEEHGPYFFTKELWSDMKIWHHFICAQLVATAHLTKVTRKWALLLYSIKKGLSINIRH